MGKPNNQGWKMGLGTPALPGASLPCPASRQGPSLGTAPAPGGQPGDAQSQRGVWGAPCSVLGVLPGPRPALLCSLRAPSCRGGGRAAGHLLRGQGTPPWCPRGTRSLCLIAAPGCVPLALGAAPVPASPRPRQRLLRVLVPVVTRGHLSQGLSHGLVDTLGQFGDVLWAQAPRVHPGEDSDGAGPWERREKPGMLLEDPSRTRVLPRASPPPAASPHLSVPRTPPGAWCPRQPCPLPRELLSTPYPR